MNQNFIIIYFYQNFKDVGHCEVQCDIEHVGSGAKCTLALQSIKWNNACCCPHHRFNAKLARCKLGTGHLQIHVLWRCHQIP